MGNQMSKPEMTVENITTEAYKQDKESFLPEEIKQEEEERKGQFTGFESQTMKDSYRNL